MAMPIRKSIDVKEQKLMQTADEELAGPTRPLSPTGRLERISALDVLRGAALMGILIANVTSFGLPGWAYAVPLGTPKPVFTGPHEQINTIVWFARWILAEGKMRALFSMLFGAGVILLTTRVEKRGAGAQVADIFLRRNMWLVVFGILHAYFVWFGDILYSYGLTAILFLYPCRKLKAKALFIAGACVLVLNLLSPMAGGRALKDIYLGHKAQRAISLQEAGLTLSDAEKADLKAWTDRLHQWSPNQKTIADDIQHSRTDYISAQLKDVREAMLFESKFYYEFAFCDALGMMLIGMALFKLGFFSGHLSGRVYTLSALIGAVVSLCVVAVGTWKAWASGFDMLTSEKWLYLPLDLGRLSGAISIASLVMLIVKAGVLTRTLSLVAAVGQTALSNYLLTSIAAKFLFVWGPWKLYGQLEYYQLYFVVAGVWCLNLVWSKPWLRYFEFGPIEWLWRSLTYWRRQPMRRMA
jgi:uncharacterized protein